MLIQLLQIGYIVFSLTLFEFVIFFNERKIDHMAEMSSAATTMMPDNLLFPKSNKRNKINFLSIFTHNAKSSIIQTQTSIEHEIHKARRDLKNEKDKRRNN